MSWNLSDGKSIKSCVIYLTKNSAASQTVATERIANKICQGQPPTFGSQYSKFHPNRFTYGGVITECVKAVLLAHRVFAIFALTSGRITTVCQRNTVSLHVHYVNQLNMISVWPSVVRPNWPSYWPICVLHRILVSSLARSFCSVCLASRQQKL